VWIVRCLEGGSPTRTSRSSIYPRFRICCSQRFRDRSTNGGSWYPRCEEELAVEASRLTKLAVGVTYPFIHQPRREHPPPTWVKPVYEDE
jgi:hypothetical protein